MPRGRCSPASPSEEGGFDEVTEFCSRTANFRSRSAICFSASKICFSASSSFLSRSISSCRNLSFSRLNRSTSRSSFSGSDRSGFTRCDERCLRFDALKHLHCQVFQQSTRPKVKILRGFCNRCFQTLSNHLNCYPDPLAFGTPDSVSMQWHHGKPVGACLTSATLPVQPRAQNPDTSECTELRRASAFALSVMPSAASSRMAARAVRRRSSVRDLRIVSR